MQLRQRLPILGWAVVLAFGCVVGLASQTASPLNGTWKLNLAKSKYSPANLAPKSSATKIVVSAAGIHLTNDSVDSQGRATHTDYTATFDGKDHPWKGTIDGKPNTDQDAIAWKKIDDRTFEVTNKLKGQVVSTQRIVVAQDGKSRTNTVTGKNAQGQMLNHTVVYDKQ